MHEHSIETSPDCMTVRVHLPGLRLAARGAVAIALLSLALSFAAPALLLMLPACGVAFFALRRLAQGDIGRIAFDRARGVVSFSVGASRNFPLDELLVIQIDDYIRHPHGVLYWPVSLRAARGDAAPLFAHLAKIVSEMHTGDARNRFPLDEFFYRHANEAIRLARLSSPAEATQLALTVAKFARVPVLDLCSVPPRLVLQEDARLRPHPVLDRETTAPPGATSRVEGDTLLLEWKGAPWQAHVAVTSLTVFLGASMTAYGVEPFLLTLLLGVPLWVWFMLAPRPTTISASPTEIVVRVGPFRRPTVLDVARLIAIRAEDGRGIDIVHRGASVAVGCSPAIARWGVGQLERHLDRFASYDFC